MRRLALAIVLFALAACTLIESKDGLVGPPLVPDSGLPESGQPTADARADAPQDGARPDAGAVPETLYDLQDEPTGIAVSGTDVAWVAGTGRRSLLRAPRDGGGPVTHLDDANEDVLDAFDLVLDATDVFWTLRGNGEVLHKAIGATTHATCFSGATHAAYIAMGGATLVTTDLEGDGGAGNVVMGVCGQPAVAQFQAPARFSGIAATAAFAYWGRSAPDAIDFGALDAGTESTFHAAMGKVDGVATDGAAVYWMEDEQRIVRLDFATQTRAVLYDAGASFGGGDVAADDVAVYWSEIGNRLIRRLRK